MTGVFLCISITANFLRYAVSCFACTDTAVILKFPHLLRIPTEATSISLEDDRRIRPQRTMPKLRCELCIRCRVSSRFLIITRPQMTTSDVSRSIALCIALQAIAPLASYAQSEEIAPAELQSQPEATSEPNEPQPVATPAESAQSGNTSPTATNSETTASTSSEADPASEEGSANVNEPGARPHNSTAAINTGPKYRVFVRRHTMARRCQVVGRFQ